MNRNTLLTVSSLILAAACGASYVFEIDSRKASLVEAESATRRMTFDRDQKRVDVELAKTQYKELKDQYDQYSSLQESKTSLTKEVASLETEKASLVKRYTGLVQATRSAAIGSKVPEVKMSTGAVITDVTFRSFTDTEVSMNHSLGVTKVLGTDLPADLNEKFRYGLIPMVDKRAEAQKRAQAAPTNVTAALTPAATPPPPSVNAANASIMKLEVEISALEKKSVIMEQTRADLQNQIDNMRQQVTAAQSAGKPTYTYNAQANQLTQKRGGVDAQLEKITQDITVLRKKIIDLAAGQ